MLLFNFLKSFFFILIFLLSILIVHFKKYIINYILLISTINYPTTITIFNSISLLFFAINVTGRNSYSSIKKPIQVALLKIFNGSSMSYII